MNQAFQRGLFVVFEGVDRVGKSTQSKLLVKALSDLTQKPVKYFCYPNRNTLVGKQIQEYLNGGTNINPHTLHLLFTANRWEDQAEIRNAISNGISVVCDRYSYSGIAYTAAKEPPAPEWDWCCKMEQGLLEPDLVISLTPESLDELISRPGYGDERYENNEFQQRVLANYFRLAKNFEEDLAELNDPELDGVSLTWHFVQSTNKTVDEVHDFILTLVQAKLDKI